MSAVGRMLEQPLDFGQRLARQLLRRGQEDRGRGRPVLGLPEEIGGAELGIDAVVGDDQRLGRAGKQVDADAAVELALGFCDEGVAGADQHVDGRNGRGSERHRADRLDAAEDEDFVGAGKVHGRDDRRMGAALVGGRRRRRRA